MTKKERRIEWWLKREVEKIKREGKKVRVSYVKIWIEDKV